MGIDTNNLAKVKKIQLTDTTIMKAGNTGGYLLPYWKLICNDKNNRVKSKILKNQQKQLLQREIVEQRDYFQSEIVLCI